MVKANLKAAINAFGSLPTIEDIRLPKAGLVMLQGRIGGRRQAFNAGEATVTRAVVSIAGGAAGFSYVLGRSAGHACLATIIDALAQDETCRQALEEKLVRPVSQRLAAARRRAAEQAAATKVDFFTLVHGEDEK
jgi:alpha-D-ribose 1-methylphosphonate 5-triphosphate synthase subunit PhnG